MFHAACSGKGRKWHWERLYRLEAASQRYAPAICGMWDRGTERVPLEIRWCVPCSCSIQANPSPRSATRVRRIAEAPVWRSVGRISLMYLGRRVQGCCAADPEACNCSLLGGERAAESPRATRRSKLPGGCYAPAVIASADLKSVSTPFSPPPSNVLSMPTSTFACPPPFPNMPCRCLLPA